MRIQIVDDLPEWVEFATKALESGGHTVSAFDPHLALVSARMLDERPAGIPFIVLFPPTITRRTIMSIARDAYKAKAQNCVYQPHGVVPLLALIEEFERETDR